MTATDLTVNQYAEWRDCDDDDQRRRCARMIGLTVEECDALAEAYEATLDPVTRAAAKRADHLRLVNDWCQLKGPGLTGMRRLTTTPPQWELMGALGKASASSTQLSDFRQCQVRILDATGQVPELLEVGSPPKPIKWAKVQRALVHAAEEVDVGDLGTDSGQVAEWLHAYLESRPAAEDLNTRETVARYPYLNDGTVHVFGTDLLHWLKIFQGENKMDHKRLCTLITGAGAVAVKVHVPTSGGKDTTTTVYRLPKP